MDMECEEVPLWNGSYAYGHLLSLKKNTSSNHVFSNFFSKKCYFHEIFARKRSELMSIIHSAVWKNEKFTLTKIFSVKSTLY